MATKLTGFPQSCPAPLFSSSSTKDMDIAGLVSDPTRKFRYAKMGAVAAVPGKVYQSPAPISNHLNLACAAAAIGATQVTVTVAGGTNVTANQYAGGLLIINDATGEGYSYLINSHPAATAGSTLVVTLEDPLVVALDATSEASLQANPYNGVIVSPATPTASPVGVAIYPIPAGEYGFIQTSGPVACLADGAITVGNQVSVSNAVAGAVESEVAGQANVGYALMAGVDTEYRAIFLEID